MSPTPEPSRFHSQSTQIGSGTVGANSNYSSSHRTSSTLLATPDALSASPALRAGVDRFRERIRDIFPEGSWGAPGALPAPGAFCFEHAQARPASPLLASPGAAPTVVSPARLRGRRPPRPSFGR